jgi:hypothetical protein
VCPSVRFLLFGPSSAMRERLGSDAPEAQGPTLTLNTLLGGKKVGERDREPEKPREKGVPEAFCAHSRGCVNANGVHHTHHPRWVRSHPNCTASPLSSKGGEC